MKKFVLLVSAVLAMTFSTVFAAEEYKSLKFTDDSGETYLVSASNLEIILSGESISFNNSDLTLPLATLVSMEFSDEEISAEVDNIIIHDSAVEVYNVNGLRAGSFDSIGEALNALDEGVYVIVDAEGNTYKVSKTR